MFPRFSDCHCFSYFSAVFLRKTKRRYNRPCQYTELTVRNFGFSFSDKIILCKQKTKKTWRKNRQSSVTIHEYTTAYRIIYRYKAVRKISKPINDSNELDNNKRCLMIGKKWKITVQLALLSSWIFFDSDGTYVMFVTWKTFKFSMRIIKTN